MTEVLSSLSGMQIVMVLVALLLGGVLKGVTGSGAPILAIPVMSAFVDLPIAVMLMLVPNLLTNIRQMVQFRHDAPPGKFLRPYLGAGVAGIVLGSVALIRTPERPLEIAIGLAVLVYVAVRLLRPERRLSDAAAKALILPAGAMAGFLQGATGLSAPATLTYLNAIGLDRRAFIATLSLLFFLFSIFHITALVVLGVYSLGIAILSVLAVVPVVAGMEIGALLAERISKRAFDWFVLCLLAAIALKVLSGV